MRASISHTKDPSPTIQTQALLDSHYASLKMHLAKNSAREFSLMHTRFFEQLISRLYHESLDALFGEYRPPKSKIPLAIYALGSFAREQLAVHSDIDMMFVYDEIEGYSVKSLIETILYKAWDLKIKIAHRAHSIGELETVASSDITIKSALLEARFIEGSFILKTHVQNRLQAIKHSNQVRFIASKLDERATLQKRFPLSMQPNIKDGAGGLRDIHLLFWIARIFFEIKHLYELPQSIIQEDEYRSFRTSVDLLFKVRNALHLIAGKKEDTLKLEYIPEVCNLIGYKQSAKSHIKFARDLFRTQKRIKLFASIWLDRLLLQKAPNLIDTTKLTLKAQHYYSLLDKLARHCNEPFEPSATLLAQLHTYAQKEKKIDEVRVASSVKRALCHSQSSCFFQTLLDARVLGKSIPVLKHIVDWPQFDGYHHYTVDIHSIKCLYHLETCDDPFLQELFYGLNKEEKLLLKLALFLHDAGKGRSKDHHQVGAILFRHYAKKLTLQPEHIKMGERLIRHHTLMSKIAQREDIFNERIVYAFISYFPSRKMLDLIYLLTYADLKGVGKGIYTSHVAQLLKRLYLNALEKIDNTTHINEAQKRIKKEQKIQTLPGYLTLCKSKRLKLSRIRSTALFLHYEAEEILDIALKAFACEGFCYNAYNESDRLVIEVWRNSIYSFNVAYLLQKLERFDLKQMDIYKLFDEIKYFRLLFDKEANEADFLDIDTFIHDAFTKDKTFVPNDIEIKRDEIEINCDYSETMASMALRCKDQKGLLANLIALFDTLGIDIASAKIHTLKRKVRDLFLIEKNGNFCHNTELIIQKLTQRSS